MRELENERKEKSDNNSNPRVSPYDFTVLVFSFALLSLEISKMQEPHHLFRQFLGKSHRSGPIVLLYLAQEKKNCKK